MTAMMAFFLVMWLTSVSDEATKSQIAQYFNPIELNDPLPPTRRRGARPVRARPDARSRRGRQQDARHPGGKPVGGDAKGGEDQAIFRDPYAVLAEIVAENEAMGDTGKAVGKPDGTGLPGLNGGDAYRDRSTRRLAADAERRCRQAGRGHGGRFRDGRRRAAEARSAAGRGGRRARRAGTPEQSDAAELQKEIDASVPGTEAADVQVKSGDAGSGTVTISLADTLDTGMFRSVRPAHRRCDPPDGEDRGDPQGPSGRHRHPRPHRRTALFG